MSSFMGWCIWISVSKIILCFRFLRMGSDLHLYHLFVCLNSSHIFCSGSVVTDFIFLLDKPILRNKYGHSAFTAFLSHFYLLVLSARTASFCLNPQKLRKYFHPDKRKIVSQYTCKIENIHAWWTSLCQLLRKPKIGLTLFLSTKSSDLKKKKFFSPKLKLFFPCFWSFITLTEGKNANNIQLSNFLLTRSWPSGIFMFLTFILMFLY